MTIIGPILKRKGIPLGVTVHVTMLEPHFIANYSFSMQLEETFFDKVLLQCYKKWQSVTELQSELSSML